MREGHVYRVEGCVDTYRQDKQLRVEKMESCKETEIEYGYFFPVSRFDPDETLKKIFQVLETLKNPFLMLSFLLDERT